MHSTTDVIAGQQLVMLLSPIEVNLCEPLPVYSITLQYTAPDAPNGKSSLSDIGVLWVSSGCKVGALVHK